MPDNQRRTFTAEFDVHDLTRDEGDALVGEVLVQAESSDGQPRPSPSLTPPSTWPKGWWAPNVKAGQIHDHPENPGRSWSSATHRLCEPVYTRRTVR